MNNPLRDHIQALQSKAQSTEAGRQWRWLRLRLLWRRHRRIAIIFAVAGLIFVGTALWITIGDWSGTSAPFISIIALGTSTVGAIVWSER